MKSNYCAAALAVVFLACAVGCDAAAKKVEFVKGADKVDVVIGGKPFTSYMFSDKLTKPVLYPVQTPSGIKVNRGFPFEEIEGEATDHPHHVGIFFTYDAVNDDGFWNNTKSPPQVKHVKVAKMQPGSGRGELCTVMHWTGKSDVLLEEKRKMVFTAGEGWNAIDFSIDLTAMGKKVKFGDTKEGMFAIRTAQWLREKDGTGRYFSSNGDKTAGNIWGKRARWVALEGEKDGKKVGIAILNYPKSVNYPTYWHARNYGLFAANPLGQLVFQKSKKVENPKPLGLTLEPGETAHFNFYIIIYDGSKTPEQLEKLFSKHPK
ncbi:MAG: PmoA family protein [Planctomycetes bacterium]|nr:PmoA family protein [Planctomycetota bacterium]